jgi:hypothetical protein
METIFVIVLTRQEVKLFGYIRPELQIRFRN